MKLALIFVFLITVVPQSPARAAQVPEKSMEDQQSEMIVDAVYDGRLSLKKSFNKLFMDEKDSFFNWRLAKRCFRTS